MKIGNNLRARKAALNAVTAVFAVISLVYVFPVLMVLLNSFKGNTFVKTETFAFLNKENLSVRLIIQHYHTTPEIHCILLL